MKAPAFLNSIKTMRWLVILTSFLFIPAFMLGVASIWAFVVGAVATLFFSAYLDKIISFDFSAEDKEGNAFFYVGSYLWAIIEVSLLTAIPVIGFLFFPIDDFSKPIFALDQYMISSFSFDWIFSQGLAEQYSEIQFFIFYCSSALISMVFVFLFLRKRIHVALDKIMYVKDTILKDGHEKRNITVTESYSSYAAISFALIFFVPFIYYEFFRRLCVVDNCSSLSLSLFFAASYMIIHIIIALYYSSNFALRRMFSS